MYRCGAIGVVLHVCGATGVEEGVCVCVCTGVFGMCSSYGEGEMI